MNHDSLPVITFSLEQQLEHPAGRLYLSVEQRVADGEFVALFGPSGAGKTSILRMLAGLATPMAGSIVVDSVIWFDSARRINLPPQLRSVGFVFQDYALFPNLSVRENVGYAAGPDAAKWIDELLEMTQLRALQHQLPARLSGGQKQRVALARAVARKPALLLLDEPLAALDVAMRMQMQDDLAALHQRLGLRSLMVSHDIGEVFRLADRVWCLQEGRIAATGTPAAVFLHRRVAGNLALRAQVLALQREEVVTIVSLLIGQDIVDIIAADDEVARLRVGDLVVLSAKTFGALRFDAGNVPVGTQSGS